MGKISRDSSTLVNYSYLSDGTKLSAHNDSGEGLVYRGPFVYRKSAGDNNSSLTLESAAFGGGRLTPDGALLYVTDYLGSVRTAVDGKTGELYKASDYSAFGDESEVGSMQTAPVPFGITLRDGYTGKENQNLDFSTNYTDFGARQYNPALRRWMTPDPLSEKYYGTSPYTFCNNNPVNLVDPDGRYIDKASTQEWNDNKRQIEDKVNSLQNKASELEAKGKLGGRLKRLNERINGLNQTLSTMAVLEDSEQGYVLIPASGSIGGLKLDVNTSLINVSYVQGDIGNFIHEVTHAGQFESGDLAFTLDGQIMLQDIYDELAAYKAEAYYTGMNPNSITISYLHGLSNDETGMLMYTPRGECNTAQISVSITTPYSIVEKAYRGQSSLLYKEPIYKTGLIYYKR